MRITRFITGLALVGSLLSPVLASASGEPVSRNGVLTPAGFCATAADGTRGIRFDGQSYDQYLSVNAIGKDRLDKIVQQENAERIHMGLSVMNPLEEGTFRGTIMKAEAAFQRLVGINPGQLALCGND